MWTVRPFYVICNGFCKPSLSPNTKTFANCEANVKQNIVTMKVERTALLSHNQSERLTFVVL